MEELPLEILYHIFTFLPLSDISNIKRVSKTLKEIYNVVIPSSVKTLSTIRCNKKKLEFVLKNKIFLSFRDIYIQLANEEWMFMNYIDWKHIDEYSLGAKKVFFQNKHLRLFLSGWSGTSKEDKHILLENAPYGFITYLNKMNIIAGKPMSARLDEIKKFIFDYYQLSEMKIVRKMKI